MRRIINILEGEITKWNSLEEKTPKPKNDLFKIEDFDYLIMYSRHYGTEYETTKFIDFCSSNVLAELSSSCERKSIWYWEGYNEEFIIPQLKYLSSLFEAYIKLRDDKKHKIAFIIFRSFIEVSSQLYACFLDFEFFAKYLSEDLQEDYKTHWFKHLKPAKVLSSLRKMNQNLKIEYKKSGKYTLGDLRGYIYPFVSEQRDMLYIRLTSYVHGKNDIMKDNDDLDELIWRISEYAASAINLLTITTSHFLSSEHYDTRKHVIFQQLWHSIKYPQSKNTSHT